MTAADRLVQLSGLAGVSAGAHLYAIRQSGTTAEQILVSRSSLLSASAAAHLFDAGSVTAPDDSPDGFYRRAAAAIMTSRATGRHNDVFVRIARRRERKP